MKPILAETYGIMLYQEQVMQVVQKVAGFTLGQADILRRAMGKKKLKEMEQQHERFMAGCKTNGIREETAENIWAKITMFAGYGFNKSHSAAYAMLSYRTAYFKANYPVEFMAAVLTSELGNAEKLSFFLAECRAMGIAVKPPDVNISGRQFTVTATSFASAWRRSRAWAKPPRTLLPKPGAETPSRACRTFVNGSDQNSAGGSWNACVKPGLSTASACAGRKCWKCWTRCWLGHWQPPRTGREAKARCST